MPRKDAIWLNLQVSPEEKTRLTDYAHYCGKSRVDVLREFIQSLPLIEKMELLEEDSKIFAQAIVNPPEPNEALKQLMQTEAPWNELKQRDNLTPITKPEIRPWLQSLVDEAHQDLAIADQLRTMADSYRDQMYAIAQILEDR